LEYAADGAVDSTGGEKIFERGGAGAMQAAQKKFASTASIRMARG
jgi:hypothetical protein